MWPVPLPGRNGQGGRCGKGKRIMNDVLYARLYARFRTEGEDHASAEEWAREAAECQGHPAGPFDPMGQEVFCDGSCRH